MIDFDYLLSILGGVGRYQILIYAMVCYFRIPSGLSSIGAVFISYSPSHRCMMQPFDNHTMYPNISESMVMNLTTPLDDNGEPVDACVKYSYDTSACPESTDLSCVNLSAQTIACDEHYFDRSLFTETTVSQFQLVCDRKVLDTIGSSLYMAGLLIGALLFGNLSDIFGRRVATIFGSYGLLIAMLGVAYSNAVDWFIFCRFLNATFLMGTNIAIFTHIIEIVDSKWRTVIGIGYQIFFAVGYMLYTPIALLFRNWHQIQLAAVVVSSPLAIIILLVPESPRWLFTSGREKQGKKVTLRMAKINKVHLPESVWQEAETTAEKTSEQKYSTMELFRHRGTAILTIKVAFNWAVNSIVYYGISLNAGSLAGDIFMNNLYGGIMEIASYVAAILLMDRVGRRLLLTITLTRAGVALLASTIVNECANDNQGLITTGVAFAFVGKGLVSASFAIVYNFTGELYPTVVRSNGLGFGSMAARVGGILAPYVISLQDHVTWLPNTIFGVSAVAGGLLALTIRDTTGKPMMETIEEAEIFYAGGNVLKKENDLTAQKSYENKGATCDDDDLTNL